MGDDERRHSQDEMLGRITAIGESNAVELTNIRERLDKIYVTKDEFNPVRNLTFGLVGLILIAFFGALIAMVIRT